MRNRDQGLQPERTVIAWRRTMLSALICGCVCFRILDGFMAVLTVLALTTAHIAAEVRIRQLRADQFQLAWLSMQWQVGACLSLCAISMFSLLQA